LEEEVRVASENANLHVSLNVRNQKLTISPLAALRPPCKSHEKATRQRGRYGAEILMSASIHEEQLTL